MSKQVRFLYDDQARTGVVIQADDHVLRIRNVDAEQFARLAKKFVATHGTRGCPFTRMTTQNSFTVR